MLKRLKVFLSVSSLYLHLIILGLCSVSNLSHFKPITMPCIFAGIFYVESLPTNRQLQCHFKDEDNVVRHLHITHFQSPNTTNHPFPDAFEMVQSGCVYFIAGTFAIHNKDNILVALYTI